MLCLWAIFLPLNTYLSVDKSINFTLNWSDKTTDQLRETRENKIFSPASTAFILQMCFMYMFSVIYKTSPIWQTEGTAIYYALSLDQLVLPPGKFLLGFPELLKILTFSVLRLEFFGPILLFVPVFTLQIRTLIVFIFIIFHIGMGLTLGLGIFPLICSAGWLALLPGWFWDKLAALPKLNELYKKMAEKFRQLVLKFPDYLKYQPREFKITKIEHIIVLLFLLTAFLWNMNNVNNIKYRFPRSLEWIALTFRIDQRWDMFSPYPLVNDGWYVIPGELKSGAVVDLFKDGAPVSWEKPEKVRALYHGERWRKYFEFSRNHDDLLYYGSYLCRKWNETHFDSGQLDNFEIFFMEERTLPDYRTEPINKKSIWKHYCFKIPEKKSKVR
jgi:hypothetical protein